MYTPNVSHGLYSINQEIDLTYGIGLCKKSKIKLQMQFQLIQYYPITLPHKTVKSLKS